MSKNPGTRTSYWYPEYPLARLPGMRNRIRPQDVWNSGYGPVSTEEIDGFDERKFCFPYLQNARVKATLELPITRVEGASQKAHEFDFTVATT